MNGKGYHIPRLSTKTEAAIHSILDDGSEKILHILHTYYDKFSKDDSEGHFSQVLRVMGETAAKVAALDEISETADKRNIAFLPGYSLKNRQRLTHKIKVKQERKKQGSKTKNKPEQKDVPKEIASELAYTINSEGDVEFITDTVSNQALVYHYLLENHPDGDGFTTGGTHQFLMENASRLRSNGYRAELLQVHSSDSSDSPSDTSVTFLNVPIDLAVLNTVDKLYAHLHSVLNDGIDKNRWPLNDADEHDDHIKKPEVYKMRGYLVSLWCKLLFDPLSPDVKTWIDDSIVLAKQSGFNDLVQRLLTLKESFPQNEQERYHRWYNLIFSPVANFTLEHKPLKEALGSAMFLTDFELKPQFFYWVHSWTSRMYRYMRQFENTIQSRVDEDRYQLQIKELKTDFYPDKVLGDRWSYGDEHQKHQLELAAYYYDFFSENTSLKTREQPYKDGRAMLDSLFLFMLLNLDKPQEELATQHKSLLDHAMSQFSKFNTSVEYSKVLGKLEVGERLTTRMDFSERLMGRFTTLGCYLYLQWNMKSIHSALFKEELALIGDADSYYNSNPSASLKQAFFIDSLSGKDEMRSRQRSSYKVWKGASKEERRQLQLWWSNLDEFLKLQTGENEKLYLYLSEQYKKIELHDFLIKR